ncbi:MAG: alpha/beta hydrolase, partial [Actinomycetia bacterium]|nr:alpha/beta hydrolase [Actinomycetes bacterium]
MPRSGRSPFRPVALVAAGLAASLLLSGCVRPAPRPGPSTTPTPHPFTTHTTPSASSSTTTSRPGADAFPLPTPKNVYTEATSPDRSAGVGATTAKVPGMVVAPGGGLNSYLTQKVDWADCPGTSDAGAPLPTQCASILAPLDWTKPDAQAITLSMKMLPATKQPALGDLFINPGGPGGSAKDYVDAFDTTGLEQYRIIGLDPRGSGDSTPVVCGTPEETDAYFDLDASPDDQAERDALLAATRAFAAECAANSGELLAHISTIEAVYDMEMVRRLLGDSVLNYVGVSYGTFIGAVYTELYPQHVGHMVLDAAVNITDNQTIPQSAGFEVSFREYATWCAGTSSCARSFGTSADEVVTALKAWLGRLDASPLAVGSRELTESLAVTGIAMFLYLGADVYSQLTAALQWAVARGDGQYLLRAADALNGRNDKGTYDSLAYAFPAIMCLDSADKGIADAWTQWATDSAAYPFFGTLMGPGLVCPVWSVKPAPQIDFSGAGAPPIVVIGGTGDNATPYQYAQWMADKLTSAVLVTRNGVGHGSYGQGNACVDSAVRDFLVADVVP